MGKDNIPFHTAMSPFKLNHCQQKTGPYFITISTTQYLNYESGKFSKRNDTGVFSDSAAETGIPSEVWRYYLLLNRPEKSDSQFSWTDFVLKNNSELLANLGYLVNRVLKFCYIEYQKIIPKVTFDQLNQLDLEFLKKRRRKVKKYVELLNNVEIKKRTQNCNGIILIGQQVLAGYQVLGRRKQSFGKGKDCYWRQHQLRQTSVSSLRVPRSTTCLVLSALSETKHGVNYQ